MSKIRLLVVLLLLSFQLTAQTTGKIEINAHKTPLDQVLLGLKESYGFQFAFDSDLLSEYTISAKRTFQTQEETLKFLVRNLPLALEKSGDVFLIVPKEDSSSQVSSTRISGQVLEAVSNEPLPYSYVLINRKPIQADQQGNFNFIASTDTDFNLQISHLGYYIYDTIVDKSIDKKFYLTPRIERIDEVQILSNPVEEATLIGDRAGRIKINHQIAPILPGHGDNSVFTLLRLMPGILAAGEQSNDLLIWGSYESHSKILFDGFTLFGLKNFNDNIAVVNPFMVKNIEVYKGGYGVQFGDRVGGIVDITGKDGTMHKPTLTFNINSTTVNGMVQVPLSKKSSLMAAYRQTYYQLYDPTSLSLFTGRNLSSGSGSDSGSGSGGWGSGGSSQPVTGLDLEVKPDYKFRDANLKYTFKGDNGEHIGISLYGGGDQFAYNAERELTWFLVNRNEKEKNLQFGGSAKYGKIWKNGDVSTLSMAYSYSNKESLEGYLVEHIKTGITAIDLAVSAENSIDEFRVDARHDIHFNEGHKLQLSMGGVNNQVRLTRIINTERTIDMNTQMPRIYGYAEDELPLGKWLLLKSGVRLTYATDLNRVYMDPRFSASFRLSDGLKFNAAWGIYHQYTAKTTMIDSLGNFSTFWLNADEKQIPVLEAQHYVAGLSYNKKGLIASLEGFYKTTKGLTQYFRQNQLLSTKFFEGEARSYGVDLFLRKEFKRHVAWVSYTLSQSEEHYPYYTEDYYQPAPQHQKHELKVAGILNYKSFYLSANYVYGSGFERFNIETEEGVKLDQAYNRMDASLVYKFKPGKVKAEAGISILNVFDTNNIKFSNLRITTVDDASVIGVYADAVPFTPAIFLKIEL